MRFRSRVLGLVFLLGAAATTTAPAHAETGQGQSYPTCTGRTVTQQESERAHTIYQAGKIQYDEGSYEAAIAQFREAYVRDCTKHDLLVIISRAYELKGDKQEAIRALDVYLERVPNSPEASAHRQRIENLRKSLAAAPPPPTPTTAPPSSTPAAAPTAQPATAEPREHTIYPWVMVGTGAVIVVVGSVFLATTPDLPANCDLDKKTCTRQPNESDQDFADRQAQAGRARQQPLFSSVAIAGGGALVVGGLIWHFLEPTGPKEQGLGPRVRPALARGYGGIDLVGRF